jgi:hypothetical protein
MAWMQAGKPHDEIEESFAPRAHIFSLASAAQHHQTSA